MADSNKKPHAKKSENEAKKSECKKNELTLKMAERAKEATRARRYEISLLEAKVKLVIARTADQSLLGPSHNRANVQTAEDNCSIEDGNRNDEENARKKRREN